MIGLDFPIGNANKKRGLGQDKSYNIIRYLRQYLKDLHLFSEIEAVCIIATDIELEQSIITDIKCMDWHYLPLNQIEMKLKLVRQICAYLLFQVCMSVSSLD